MIDLKGLEELNLENYSLQPSKSQSGTNINNLLELREIKVSMESKIPKVIHKILLTDDEENRQVPPEMGLAVKSFKIMNPDFDVRVYNL